MQIVFDPKNVDVAEAAVILGMLLPALVNHAKAQGDTRDEVVADVAELTGGVWDALSRSEEGA